MDDLVLHSIPRFDGCEHLLQPVDGGLLVIEKRPDGATTPRAFIDADTHNAWPCNAQGRHDASSQPLVLVVGVPGSDATGQVKIRQDNGHYMRYCRWDAIDGAPGHPDAVVRTLPQCGCGGYLGTPMMFDDYVEMVAYFFVVFTGERANDGTRERGAVRQCTSG